MSINFKLNYDLECSEEDSKLFGEIALPEKWLEDDVFSPFEIFICQINLDCLELNTELLPKEGTLFFFIDAKKSPFKAVVRYSNDELEAVTGFNDDCEGEENVIDDIGLECCSDCGDVVLLASEGENVELLRIINPSDNRLLPFKGNVSFWIAKADLIKKDFSKTKLVFSK